MTTPPAIWRDPHPDHARLADPLALLVWRVRGVDHAGRSFDRQLFRRREFVEPLVADLLTDGAHVTHAQPDGWASDIPI